MRLPTLLMSAMLALCLPLAGAAAARPGGEGEGMIDLRRLDRIAGELGVDDATLARIKDLAYDAQKRAIGLEAQLQVARMELRRALEDADPDRGKVLGLVDEVGRLDTTLRRERMAAMLDIRALLTPEQVQKLKARRADRRAGRRERREHRRPGASTRQGEPPEPPDGPEDAPPRPPPEVR